MKLINQGKVKDVYDAGKDKLLFVFSDRISVFDQIIPSEIPRKGETLCRESAFWFEKVEKLGIKTHYLEMPKPNQMLVRRAGVIHDYAKLTNKTVNYQIPLEVILRWYCAGSFYQALKSGKKKPSDFGLDHMPRYGERLPEPYFEQTTKFEKVDRKLNIDEALKISGLTHEELAEIKESCIKIDEMMQKEVGKRGLIHVDGKKEFAMDEGRNVMVIDTFGTADEDRFWDAKEYEKGNIIEFSKEFVRKYYENDVKFKCPICSDSFSYKQLLDKTRAESLPDPAIPALPKEMVERTSKLYADLYARITGQRL
ncbi:MAG: phosphoribosylaminoimidazolesuccinocarboxamide synthase [Candidatus Altiarchaeota archaeon]|nr:phosphoribosylaminoimidazolesuccinocarboxamide synthase [Candidatus Altiarchaeota archaeon]